MHSRFRPHSIVDLNERPQRILTLVLLSTLLSGCGEKVPFELEAVSGTITYSDGSFVKADQLLLKFVPQGIQAIGRDAPRSAETFAELADGTFTDFTTWKHGDGVMVGRHKVVVMSLRVGSHGVGEPTNAVPTCYHKANKTPLEVEVISGGENSFSLEIEKGA
ncbi:MAG: hypothetical protein ABGX16_01920 [Pirellulales bacterium]